ncbi:MAG: helix-turn-helix domain-containing protein [Candidatus Hodarchaeales archaeon]
MIQSKISISSKKYYTCQLTAEIPVKITIVAIILPEGFAIVEPLQGGEKELIKYAQQMKNSDPVVEFEITYSSPEYYWTRSVHKLDFPSIYETIIQSGSMTMMPVIIKGGKQYHVILSPSPGGFKKLIRMLKARFEEVSIKHLSTRPWYSRRSILTLKQEEAILLAYKAGYYDIPRRVKIADLAPRIKIKRVAMQERLRRAELKIINDFMREQFMIFLLTGHNFAPQSMQNLLVFSTIVPQ